MSTVPTQIDVHKHLDGHHGARVATVRLLAEAIEAKDPYLRGHSDEVSGWAACVADRLGMDDEAHDRLVLGSLLHDVGKLAIGESILLKPAGLTPEERSAVEQHAAIGSRIVEHVPGLSGIAPAVLHHHERWDGGGYPEGLRGEEIPLEARIIAVADSYSAMTADRPYRRRMPSHTAQAELRRCAGTQFDPEVVGVFCEELSAQFAA
jgi:HD-GYP domain-containing protein (c-di-GMP phosphodiesterase class II)